jgi:predicted lipid-binding transport protein (Tim44 family)
MVSFQELQQMLQTPIKPYCGGDSENLPSLTTRAMSKGFRQIMMHTDTNEENLGVFIKLLDTA